MNTATTTAPESNRKFEKPLYALHPEVEQFFGIIKDIFSLVPVGNGHLGEFWKRYSLDCSFLEFGPHYFRINDDGSFTFINKYAHIAEWKSAPRVELRFEREETPRTTAPCIEELTSGVVIASPAILGFSYNYYHAAVNLYQADCDEQQYPQFEYSWEIGPSWAETASMTRLHYLKNKDVGAVYGHFNLKFCVGCELYAMPRTLEGLTQLGGREIPFEIPIKPFLDKMIALGKIARFRQVAETIKNHNDEVLARARKQSPVSDDCS